MTESKEMLLKKKNDEDCHKDTGVSLKGLSLAKSETIWCTKIIIKYSNEYIQLKKNRH